jgi:acetyl esterase/lipase
MTVPPSPKPRRPDVDQVFQESARYLAAGQKTDDLVIGVRRMVARFGDVEPERLEGTRFIPVSAQGLSLEWVVAEGADLERRIVHCHGGGWVAGGIDSSRARGVALSRVAGASVLLVDYRLAPEHPLPAGLDDCRAAIRWARANGPEGATPSRKLSLCGESAGASLAAAACAGMIEAGEAGVDHLILLSPQLSVAAAVDRVARDDPMVSQDKLWHAYSAYTGRMSPPDDPRVSPLYTAASTLARFPPTFIQVSGAELFLHDARVFAGRLIEADVRHVLSVWPGMPHSWHAYLDALPEASAALEELAVFLAR